MPVQFALAARPFLLLALVSLLLLQPAAPTTAAAAGVRILRSDQQGLLVEVTTPWFSLHSSPAGLAVSAPGLTLAPLPGAAMLPSLTLPLRLPTNQPPTVTLHESTSRSVALPGSLARQPVPLPPGPPDLASGKVGLPRFTTPSTRPGGYEPGALYTLEPPQAMRGQTIALLRVHPLQVDWDSAMLHHHQRLLLEIRYAPAAANTAVAASEPDLFRGLLDRSVINPAIHTTPPPRIQNDSGPPPDSPATTAGSLKLFVDQPGIYQLSGSALIQAGWAAADLTTERLTNLKLTRDGVEVPLDLSGQGDQLLLRFHGQPRNSRYQAEQVYWLFSGNSAGLRAPAALGAGTPLRWEQNSLYSSQHASFGRDGWFAQSLKRIPGSEALTATLTLPRPVSAGTRLEVGLQGETVTRHKLEVIVANSSAGILSWDDSGASVGNAPPFTGMLTLTTSLPAGAVELTLKIPAAIAGDPPIDAMFVDWIAFPEVLVAEPATPLTPRILADTPSNLASGGADYLIVSYAAFIPALAPLVAYHQSRGLQVRVVDVQDSYDEFNHGNQDPEAIRAFVRLTVQDWNPAPSYLLLVGDGTTDFKNYLGNQRHHNFLPPYLADIDPWLGEVACDTCFARVQNADGLLPLDPRTDQLPDLLVGRLPVSSLQQAQNVVAKIVGYATSPPAGIWRAQHLVLADDYIDANGTPDAAGDFVASAELAISQLPAGTLARRFYYDPAPLEPGQVRADDRYADPSKLRDAFFAAFDQGAGLVTYVGHASYWQWGYTGDGVEPPFLWSLYDADIRSNGAKLPILLAMTCQTGIFQEPTLPELGSTDERLLTEPEGGTLASLSSAGNGVAYGHDFLYQGVIGALQGSDAATRSLGAAQLAGFTNLLSRTNCCQDTLFTYQIFGDPASQLAFTPADNLYLPLLRR